MQSVTTKANQQRQELSLGSSALLRRAETAADQLPQNSNIDRTLPHNSSHYGGQGD